MRIGQIGIGDNEPIVIQSMTNLSALDSHATIKQIRALYARGCKVIRFATQRAKEIEALAHIKSLLREEFPDLVMVADTHFSPIVAELATEVFDKVRINPGNFVDRNTKVLYTDEQIENEQKKIQLNLIPFLQKCKKENTAVRIGTNHGSLSERILQKYGNTPKGMVYSVVEFIEIAVVNDFSDIIISLKASSPKLMIEANRLMLKWMIENKVRFPLHLGVTEAGNGDEGRIKSAIGIATLLLQGIGDTIRVSLTENPVNEIRPAELILKSSNVSLKRNKYQELNALNKSNSKIPIVVSTVQSITNEKGTNIPDYYIQEDKIKANGTNIAPSLEIDNWNIIESIFDLRKYSHRSPILFRVNFSVFDKKIITYLKPYENVTIIARINSDGYYAKQMREILNFIYKNLKNVPVILEWISREKDWEKFIIETSAQLGALFVDNYGEGILIRNKNFETKRLNLFAFKILQYTNRRLSMPEIISCPSCGRTLFDIEAKVNELKQNLKIIKNKKIAVMGCIVNGLGEMADADYGLVGAGSEKINIFYQRKLVRKNIDANSSISSLLDLLYENGDIKSK